MLAKLQEQLQALLQALGLVPQSQPIRISEAEQERLRREVPLGRLVSAREDAEFAAYLCSAPAACFVGQVFPVCGGWVGR